MVVVAALLDIRVCYVLTRYPTQLGGPYSIVEPRGEWKSYVLGQGYWRLSVGPIPVALAADCEAPFELSIFASQFIGTFFDTQHKSNIDIVMFYGHDIKELNFRRPDASMLEVDEAAFVTNVVFWRKVVNRLADLVGVILGPKGPEMPLQTARVSKMVDRKSQITEKGV
ncbi:hypothetical protein M8C21_003912 [Ambrosia artemisiifolia]|uniref:Uncharacterized protein n=1 Tax=Ambrosia artemisiifolia TaxID=4212 RepID=A0AAD5C4P6_AMBAR|nr:hypothetical protein M8C21_003912 [Ambrosia artemisiifolia]